MERRLAAVLAADMVGYSRLVERDAAGVLDRQRNHRRHLIDPAIDRAGGRIVKTTGDGLLAEFPSIRDAVQCAVDVQTEMPLREDSRADDTRIRYR
ncbi:adenylate/guanylate cyclase domain-containing protein, partial [Cribrihabitans sp. XS_ASV171]